MRKVVVFVLVLMMLISSCSRDTSPSNSEEFLTSSDSSELTVQTTQVEKTVIDISVIDGHIVGSLDTITVDIPININYPNIACVYKIACDYPFQSIPESYLNFNTAEHSWYYYYLFNDENHVDFNTEPLFETQSLAEAYRNESTTSNVSFVEFALSNRISNVSIIDIDDTCVDFLSGLDLDINNYTEAIYCCYCSPNGLFYQKYNIPQQIDGINIFDGSVYPQYSSSLGFVNWGGYVGRVGAMTSLGVSYSFPLISDNNDICLTDLHNYEIVEVVDENLEIIPLEECINSNLSYSEYNDAYSVFDAGGNTWFYLADLVYIPVQLINETTGKPSEDCYLFPCWVLFYTRIIDNNGYYTEIDGVVAINAITGENIDVADETYNDNWSD